jgi:hypothetical protein
MMRAIPRADRLRVRDKNMTSTDISSVADSIRSFAHSADGPPRSTIDVNPCTAKDVGK